LGLLAAAANTLKAGSGSVTESFLQENKNKKIKRKYY
jgi:hypothetical protein